MSKHAASPAFYRRIDEGLYSSGPSTAGPWSPTAQHGGPPSALLGRALEKHAARDGFRIARVTLELPRPVPVGDLQVHVRTRRSGGRTELLEGELTAGGKEVLTARAWRVAESPATTPRLRPTAPPPQLPPPQLAHTMTGAHMDGYISAMEWRFVEPGTGFDTPGPGTAWVRQRIPLVDGEEDTPLTRALTVADSSWAVAFELDHHKGLVINTDVTLALHRAPVGEWFCVRSATAASPHGSGLALGQLDDEAGDCGRVLQTLLVADR
ncbi:MULTISPECIES: thioesterase family protein [unclassified Streptomyces]|uniref:thioesterase family protein n=1 Tax=unclassified Streptomyces TaxID=2593676 RepID=UPI00278C6969|nr:MULTISPECIES: thioesterase family protein [unclassified Streptomyces]